LATTTRVSFEPSCETIWVKAKSPTARATKLIPSAIVPMPKVKRCTPESRSVPKVPSSKPSTAIEIVVRVEPLEITETATSARTIIAAYSAEPKLNATAERIGENSAMTTTATQPAKNEPSAEMQSAGPALPCRAIG
jgi:hypothetical protein